jgi:hypothetical protein
VIISNDRSFIDKLSLYHTILAKTVFIVKDPDNYKPLDGVLLAGKADNLYKEVEDVKTQNQVLN